MDELQEMGGVGGRRLSIEIPEEKEIMLSPGAAAPAEDRRQPLRASGPVRGKWTSGAEWRHALVPSTRAAILRHVQGLSVTHDIYYHDAMSRHGRGAH